MQISLDQSKQDSFADIEDVHYASKTDVDKRRFPTTQLSTVHSLGVRCGKIRFTSLRHCQVVSTTTEVLKLCGQNVLWLFILTSGFLTSWRLKSLSSLSLCLRRRSQIMCCKVLPICLNNILGMMSTCGSLYMPDFVC